VRAYAIGIKRARGHRQALTGGELGLWVRIKGRQLDGYQFRRQHPIGPYILDFYCAAVRLAVEIDGYSHEVGNAPAHDARRDAWLLERGIETLRISAELAKRPGDAAAAVLHEVRRRAPSATP
jgi:very-short-patch-repair endonuclease